MSTSIRNLPPIYGPATSREMSCGDLGADAVRALARWGYHLRLVIGVDDRGWGSRTANRSYLVLSHPNLAIGEVMAIASVLELRRLAEWLERDATTAEAQALRASLVYGASRGPRRWVAPPTLSVMTGAEACEEVARLTRERRASARVERFDAGLAPLERRWVAPPAPPAPSQGPPPAPKGPPAVRNGREPDRRPGVIGLLWYAVIAWAGAFVAWLLLG